MKKVALSIWTITSIFLVGLTIDLELNFINPNDALDLPFGYWELNDLPRIFSDQNNKLSEVDIQIFFDANIIGIEYISNGVYQVFFSEISTFANLRDIKTFKETKFSHQGDLYDNWDDVFVGGARALIFGREPDSNQFFQYKCIIFSPDFDAKDGELMFYMRIPSQEENFDELVKQADLQMKVVEPKLFESFNLVDGGLVVETFSPDSKVFDD
jgi:hypothetical protein